jgi:hypothetical protein
VSTGPDATEPLEPAGPDPRDGRQPSDSLGRDSAAVVEVEATGEPRVDQAVAELARLDELPTSDHADVYEDVHHRLHSALTELDTD